MAAAFFTPRGYVSVAVAYSLARKAPSLWNGTVLAKDGDDGGAVRHRPMLVGERMQVAVIVAGLAPIMGLAWVLNDVVRAEIALRGEDARRYGREPPETQWEHVLS